MQDVAVHLAAKGLARGRESRQMDYHTKASSYSDTTDVLAKLQSVNWDFAGVNGRDRLHDIHPYPAKFIPQIPRELIRLFHPGDDSVVLDPFCGSGTTLVEAVRAGLPTIGIDIHPLAILIAKTKTTPLKFPASPIARELVRKARAGSALIPQIPRLNHWFLPEVQQALANLVDCIGQVEDRTVQDCLKVALSRIIVRVSNQESDTRYAAIQKQITSGQVYELFMSSVLFVEQAVLEAYGGFFSVPPRCGLINQNILDVSANTIATNIGLVVTSPPYPNAYEYWLYHKYRMYWLGMDPLAVRNAEIGARAHYFRKNPATEVDFENQMTSVFRLMSQIMSPGSYACFLVGRSVIHGRRIDNRVLLKRAAARSGFHCKAEVERRISQSQKAFNPAVSTINEESIMVFLLDGER